MIIEDLLSLLILTPPLLLLISAFISRFQSGLRPKLTIRVSFFASVLSIFIAIVACIMVYQFGKIESSLLGSTDLALGFSIRIDPLNITMYTMIALLGFIVVKFSSNYLDGDAGHGKFMGRLSSTIAAVQVLVLSGNLLLFFLSWVATSMALHRLLIFYPERRRAVTAAKKKFVVARLGDFCLLAAFTIVYLQFNSGNLQDIFVGMQNIQVQGQGAIELAAVFLALAAILKSAQFPTHGWLIEVMETPTPVSALLHAGLLNAGPFLMVRFSYILSGTEIAPLVLIVFGGLTAFFASVTFLTQPAIKTALGFSSVAHMGFMLLVCGLGVYPAAMLHLVAHSFYKAHAFLSSGSAVDVARASNIASPKRLGSPWRVAASIAISMLVYLAFSTLWGINPAEELALLATGAIVVMGLAQIIAPALDSDGYLMSTLKACLLAIAVASAFFTLESGAHQILFSQLPQATQPTLAVISLIIVVLIVFSLTVFLQIVAPAQINSPLSKKLGIHFRNGWYINAMFDRLVGAWNKK